MLACGRRRSEVAELTMQHLQQREEHWVIADLIGKAAHIRTVPVPGGSVKATIDGWMTAAGITVGPLFRCISRRGTIWGEGITRKVIWHVVKESAAQAGMRNCRLTIVAARARGCAAPQAAS
jgi:site-specific recombinase XerD